jgi:tRNA pseudouridine13 synthase
MQRFGKYYDTHLVGIAVLKGDFEKAVKIIMDEKPDEFPRIAEARSQWARRFKSIDITADEKSAREAEMKCARAIQNVLGRFMNCEKSIVSSLARKPRDYQAAFCSIAKNMRSMFLHAYQSYLWNMVASHRMESGENTEVRVGDLVQIETGMDCTSSGTSGLKGKSVKLITEEDVLNSRYKITDVVLPLAGSKIMYPGGMSGKFFDELLKKDGISKSDFAKIGDVVDREIALGGDYRKLICKPDDVSFEIKVYRDPLQPLLQTDLMKVKNIDVAAITLSSSSKDHEMHTQNQAVLEDNQQEDIIFGMNVGFSLPSSSYATIALRELTKRPTSSEYQSKLEVGGGRCERNVIVEGGVPN